MSESRRPRRPDSRQMWDESDRPHRPRDRDRLDRERDRDRDSERPRPRSRSRERRGGYNDRSKSPDRRYRDRGSLGRGRSGQDKSPRDSRRFDDRERDRPHARRRSASPASISPPLPSTLPTRPRPDKPSHAPASSRRHQLRDDTPITNEDEAEPGEADVDDDMDAMQRMMGFGDFGTTKGKKVAGNSGGAVRKEKKTEYRQYMNRQGGFNRPLSPSR